MKKTPYIILNPTSGGGLGKKLWPEMKECLERFFKHITLRETTAPGDAEKFARAACDEGYNIIVACGGDGTIHEIINGILKAPKHHDVALGFLNAGTGGDFIKTLKLPDSIQEQANILFHHKTERIDIGKIEFEESTHEARFFINIADFGVGGLVVAKLLQNRKVEGASFLDRKMAYLTSTLKSYLEWIPQDIEVTADKNTFTIKNASSVVIANGEFFGGGMPIANKASLGDGLFDIIAMSNEPFFLKLPLMPLKLLALYLGHVDKMPFVRRFKCRKVSLKNISKNQTQTALDIDGEPFAHLPATFTIMPRALNIISP
ncbi:MAG: diacylglycerol kinase family lipid kinase [Deltaproteobacteria bacterium]|nr:MAG: diacylglycerol kinase family lipid kinase [Deltaproteobacteria bacterium]